MKTGREIVFNLPAHAAASHQII